MIFRRFPDFGKEVRREERTVKAKGSVDGHLARFVRAECANYDSHHKLCTDD